MADDKLTDGELETLFDTAQRRAPQPSPVWLAQVAADASAVLEQRRTPPAPSLWDQLFAVLGGGPGLGGLVAACAVGVWLGFAPPALLGDPVGTALGAGQTVDLLGDTALDYATLLDEG